MRFPSGVTDQYIYFMAVDETDYVTPETGLSAFTVYRSRNGGSATAYTTPTISEISSSNMPGVYRLLLDEDMTIDSGDHSQEVVLRITATGMALVTLKYELYRPDVTAGQTLAVSSGNGNAAVQSIANNALTASAIASDAITAAKVASDVSTEIASGVWGAGTRTLTANPGLTASDVRTALGMSSANLDTQIATLATASSLATVAGYIDTEIGTIISNLGDVDTVVDAIKAKTDNLPSDPADQSLLIAAIGTVEGKVDTVDSVVDAIKAKTDALPSDPADQSAVEAAISSATSGLATSSDLATVDANVDAILATSAKLDDTLEDVGGWRFTEEALAEGPAGGGGGGGPTAEEIADEVQTRTIAAVTVVNGLAANSVTASALAADAVSEIQSGLASQSSVDDLPTNAELATALAGADDAVLAQIALVKAKTDSLTFTTAGVVNAGLYYVNGIAVTGTGTEADPWGP